MPRCATPYPGYVLEIGTMIFPRTVFGSTTTYSPPIHSVVLVNSDKLAKPGHVHIAPTRQTRGTHEPGHVRSSPLFLFAKGPHIDILKPNKDTQHPTNLKLQSCPRVTSHPIPPSRAAGAPPLPPLLGICPRGNNKMVY